MRELTVAGCAFAAFQLGKLLQWVKDAKGVMNNERKNR
jgi:hypothetical protein